MNYVKWFEISKSYLRFSRDFHNGEILKQRINFFIASSACDVLSMDIEVI